MGRAGETPRVHTRGDVIAAAATPAGPALRAVVRLSGPRLIEESDRFLPAGCPRPRRRRAALEGQLEWSPGSRVPAHLLVFPGPESATGEDVVEIHLPGCQPVADAVLQELFRRGARPAEPGEFTRRAFLNGRLDLSQAEAVLDLVLARSAQEARAAARILAGSLGERASAARAALEEALAELEARLDFEEGDTADLRPAEVVQFLRRAEEAVAEGLAGEERRRATGGLSRIGLVGAPNAGKTSLFRRLTGVGALVSPEPGTTRDRLEGRWQPPGAEAPWILADGPGSGGEPVDERDAAARQRARGDVPDLVWLVADGSDPAARLVEPPPALPVVVVWTHADLPWAISDELLSKASQWGPAVWVSSVDGRGTEELAAATARELRAVEAALAATGAASDRHRAALRGALEALRRADGLHGSGGPADLVAEEVRAALWSLGELAGRQTPEDLLDRIFSRFCIGK